MRITIVLPNIIFPNESFSNLSYRTDRMVEIL